MNKVLGTAVVWAGVLGVGFLSHYSGHLDGHGIGLLTIVAGYISLIIWDGES